MGQKLFTMGTKNHTTVKEFEKYIGTNAKIRKIYANKNGQIIGALLADNKKYKFTDPPTYKKRIFLTEIYVKSQKYLFWGSDLFVFEDCVTDQTLSSEIADWLFCNCFMRII